MFDVWCLNSRNPPRCNPPLLFSSFFCYEFSTSTLSLCFLQRPVSTFKLLFKNVKHDWVILGTYKLSQLLLQLAMWQIVSCGGVDSSFNLHLNKLRKKLWDFMCLQLYLTHIWDFYYFVLSQSHLQDLHVGFTSPRLSFSYLFIFIYIYIYILMRCDRNLNVSCAIYY